MAGLVEEFMRWTRTLERITRPPRLGYPLDVDVPAEQSAVRFVRADELANLGAEQLAEREAEEEVSDPFNPPDLTDRERAARERARAQLQAEREAEEEVHEPSVYDLVQGSCWEPDVLPEPPLTDDELVAVRGLIQERYEPESVEDYMARAERVESGYIIHKSPRWLEDDDRLAGLAKATYSSAIPPADDPAGVEHSPVPPAGIPDDGVTYQKSESCWCGEHLSAEGTEDEVLLACRNFRLYHSHTPPADDPAGVEHSPVPPAGIRISSQDLLTAAHYVDEAATSASRTSKRRLELLATRLRDASRARRK